VSQVPRRARWRPSNSGLRIEAACLTAEIMAEPRSGRSPLFEPQGACV
jgi:hypothetical protein